MRKAYAGVGKYSFQLQSTMRIHLGLILIFIHLTLSCTRANTTAIQSPTQPTPSPQLEQSTKEDALQKALNAKLLSATTHAQETFRHSFLSLAPEDQDILHKSALRAQQAQNYEAAHAILERASELYPEETRWWDFRISLLLAQHQFAQARAQARHYMLSARDHGMSLYWQALEADPSYSPTIVQTLRPQSNNALSALGGGSTVTLKYKVDGQNVAAIKPDQDLRQSMYRSEIAFYRLCEILECSFSVPENRPVRIARGDLQRLYDSSSAKNRGYKQKFVHLLWKTEEGKDYLYATHKAWVPDFVFFPIEITQAWRPYLNQPNKEAPSLQRFLTTLQATERPNHRLLTAKFDEFTQNMSTTQLLAQISDIILLDFLTNNWDRFSGDPQNYGANCHLQPGGLVAIDNGAAFPPWHTPRVQRRLHMVTRFSKKIVANLRNFDPDEILLHLFPNPTRDEQKAFALFKERRNQALSYIDELIQKYGPDQVLSF